jgi:hypothetical protein
VPSVYGYDVDSAVPLRRLNPAPGSRGKLRVVPARGPVADREGRVTGFLETDDGRPVFVVAEVPDGCLIWCARSGAYLVDPASGTIEAEANGDPELFEHRLLSSAVCTLLSLRGDLVLHAAAVEIAGGAVVFCAPTGRGKSTLARALGELGAPVLSEDGVVIAREADGWLVHPGARGVRIRPPGRADAPGLLQPDPGPAPQPRPLTRLVALEPRGEDLRLDVLDAVLALPRLASNLVHTGGRESVAASFQLLADVCARVEVMSLILPDSLERLSAAAATLMDSLSQRR